MTAPNRSDESHDPRFDRILAAYIEALEAGQDATVETWIRRYPEFETPLREFIASNRRLDQIVPRTTDHTPADVNARTIGHSVPSGDAEPADPALPDRLRYFGDYELTEEVARGGTGVVYRGRQVSLNRPVAVKMILAAELASPDDVARFELEAQAAANLDHPGIVPIYEIGKRDGRHYFSMKFIAGESLAQRLKKRTAAQPTLPLKTAEARDAVRLVAAVARAVHFAHQRGIIHRDLKPANILIDEQGQPHVTDFGLAKRVSDDSELTHTGTIVGTPSYMAPEQAKGNSRGVTTAADIYGLGAILYASLANRPPFEGNSPLETLLKVQQEPHEKLGRFCPAIDSALESVCDKCLAKDPEARYRSAGELADDLERWLNGEPIYAAPPDLSTLLWRWLAANFRSVIGVGLLGLVTGVLVSEMPRFVLARNLSPYLNIYEQSFPQQTPPWMLRAISAYPVWAAPLTIPLAILLYLCMGWLVDRIVHPKTAAAAILAGMGLGSAAAAVAFLAGFGWMMINQAAIWPGKPDLELIAATVDNNTTFTGGRTMSAVYPTVPARYVMKKALVDMQSGVPLAIWYGLQISVSFLFLPATAQAWAAFALRKRGDAAMKQLLHLVELSAPMSLLLVGLGFTLFVHPWVNLLLIVFPLVGVVLVGRARRLSQPARRNLSVVIGVLGILVLGYFATDIFSPADAGGFSLGLLLVGTIAAACAVFRRWPWWGRILVYGVWWATFAYCGVRETMDATQIHARTTVSLIGSGAVVLLGGFVTWYCTTSARRCRR
jgi:eukaryotic-like serine/threonine-protein kinase